MSNLSDRTIHSIFGCLNEGFSDRVPIGTGTPSALTLVPNELYRLISSEDVHVSISGTGEAAISVDAPYMSADIPEMFSSTGDKVQLRALAMTAGTGDLYVTRMITRGN